MSEASNLPKTWVNTTIGDVYEVVGGGTPSTKNREYWSGNVPWITSADISGVRKIEVSRYITDKAIENSTTNKVPPETLLVVTRVGLGKIAIADCDICFSQDLQGLIALPEIMLPHFSLYYLSFALQSLKYEGRGTTISGITKKQLKDTKLPIPPLSEQRRIVAKIEELFSELDRGIECLRISRIQLDVYRQALLKNAFQGKLSADWREENRVNRETSETLLNQIEREREDNYQQQVKEWKSAISIWEKGGKEGAKPKKPTKQKYVEHNDESLPELPEGWVWQCLGNLNTVIFDGPFGSNLKTSDYVSSGVRVIRLENIGYREFIDEKKSFITEEKYELLKKHTVASGDIIFSSFVTDGVRTVILPKNIERAVNKADCFCIRLYGTTTQNSFLEAFLNTQAVYKRIESEIHGIGRPRINTTQLKNIAVPVCSIREQSYIVEQLSEKLSFVANLKEEIDKQIEKSDALRQSILKIAFSGMLVEQDPNDEPASALLERIRAVKEEGKKGKKVKKGKAA